MHSAMNLALVILSHAAKVVVGRILPKHAVANVKKNPPVLAIVSSAVKVVVWATAMTPAMVNANQINHLHIPLIMLAHRPQTVMEAAKTADHLIKILFKEKLMLLLVHRCYLARIS